MPVQKECCLTADMSEWQLTVVNRYVKKTKSVWYPGYTKLMEPNEQQYGKEKIISIPVPNNLPNIT
jgi:hypothetical protein